MEDNGYGMTPEYLEVIFDAFTRAENSTTDVLRQQRPQRQGSRKAAALPVAAWRWSASSGRWRGSLTPF